jgi:7-carboxy-7-deazaguanine synthase
MLKITPVNVDRNLPARHFLGTNMLFVSSIFRTVQGEGFYAGHPAVFLRLAGCNFGAKSVTGSCCWCDTKFVIGVASQYSPEALVEEILSLRGPHVSDILVLTGGEPTLQPLVLKVLDLLVNEFSSLQIETNGTQGHFFENIVGHVCNMSTRVVVSPKANYTTRGYPPINGRTRDRLDDLKFILDSDPASPHHVVPDWAFTLRDQKGVNIYVSPMARYLRPPTSEVASAWDSTLVDQAATAKNYEYAANFAMRYGVLLSIQQHLFCSVP